jgi:hypothetical protein
MLRTARMQKTQTWYYGSAKAGMANGGVTAMAASPASLRGRGRPSYRQAITRLQRGVLMACAAGGEEEEGRANRRIATRGG